MTLFGPLNPCVNVAECAYNDYSAFIELCRTSWMPVPWTGLWKIYFTNLSKCTYISCYHSMGQNAILDNVLRHWTGFHEMCMKFVWNCVKHITSKTVVVVLNIFFNYLLFTGHFLKRRMNSNDHVLVAYCYQVDNLTRIHDRQWCKEGREAALVLNIL